MENKRKQPSLLKVITDEEVELIHQQSLKILYEIGVKIPNHQLLDKFDQAGAEVNFDTQIVKIPEELITKTLANLNKDFSMTPADGGPPVQLGTGRLQLSMDTTPDIVNIITNQKRRGTAADVLEGIAVANELENVRLATGYCLPKEIAQNASDVYTYELLWTYSKKPIATWIYSARSADYILEMAKIVSGGEEQLKIKKPLTYFAEPISPLRYSPHTLDIILKFSPYEIPIYLGPMVTMGGSGPVTIAGTLALHNAEMLQGLVLIYLCNRKQPVIYSCHCHSLDLSRMVTQYGAPEQALLAVGATQLAKKYGLAVCGNVMLTDSNCADYMAGFQAGTTVAYALAAGWDMFGFNGFGTMGVIGNGVGHSLEMAVMQDEALSYLMRVLRSFDVNQETLAYKSIAEVGIGGNYMSIDHTVKHMRDEVWTGTGIFKNYDYQIWSDQGAEDITIRAHRRVKQILKSRLPLMPVLSSSIRRELEQLTQAAKKESY